MSGLLIWALGRIRSSSMEQVEQRAFNRSRNRARVIDINLIFNYIILILLLFSPIS